MKLLPVMWLALALTGCATAEPPQQPIFGGGKPTTVECSGKGMVSAGPYAFQADCGPDFKFKINVQ